MDWVAGGKAYELDGTVHDPHINYAYPFDGCATSPDGRYAVIYTRLGTKGLLLRDGKILRELNRSYYCAEAYEYPVCLWQSASGRVLLAHCPREYNLIEIEDADTGESLASWGARDPGQAADFFHSRLQASPTGKRLLSAGWVWHPWDAVVFFDVARALADPSHLGSLEGCVADSRHVGLAEESSAAWLTDDQLILTGGDEKEDPESVAEREDLNGLRPRGLAVYDVPSRAMVSSTTLERPAGTIMAAGPDHVVAFYRHPRLIRLQDGAVVHEWRDLSSGEQLSSITHHIDAAPPLAIDPVGRRFALATDDTVHVVVIDRAD